MFHAIGSFIRITLKLPGGAVQKLGKKERLFSIVSLFPRRPFAKDTFPFPHNYTSPARCCSEEYPAVVAETFELLIDSR